MPRDSFKLGEKVRFSHGIPATDTVVIKGLVTIWQEDPKTGERKYLVKNAENHWVDAGLKGLVSALIGGRVYASPGTYYGWVNNFKIYLGTDTAQPTYHNMTALVSPIGTAPGTPPDHTDGADITNPATGQWKTSYIAIWYAGTLPAVSVGEVALYLKPFDNLTPRWDENALSKSQVMVSRLSVADGNFTAFPIDVSKSLTVQWDILAEFV